MQQILNRRHKISVEIVHRGPRPIGGLGSKGITASGLIERHMQSARHTIGFQMLGLEAVQILEQQHIAVDMEETFQPLACINCCITKKRWKQRSLKIWG